MTTGYSTLSTAQSKEEIRKMRETTKRLASSRGKARAFLIRAGILAKNGKQLAAQYR
jgi:hypothetical protein